MVSQVRRHCASVHSKDEPQLPRTVKLIVTEAEGYKYQPNPTHDTDIVRKLCYFLGMTIPLFQEVVCCRFSGHAARLNTVQLR